MIERKALLIGAFAYLFMGLCGWITYYLSGSEALLLDGNYNLITGLASVAGFYIVKLRSTKTNTFPFGKYVFESLYALIKGLMVLGILIAALYENSLKIYMYFALGIKHEINAAPIGFYAVAMVAISFSLAAFYHAQNKKTGNISTMLNADKKTAIIDGMLSGFAGGGLILFSYLGATFGQLEFLRYIGDAIIVVIFVLLAIKEPIHIIRQNFLEIAGGQLQSEEEYQKILELIDKELEGQLRIADSFIGKTGSLYYILIYVKGRYITGKKLRYFTHKIRSRLPSEMRNAFLELIYR